MLGQAIPRAEHHVLAVVKLVGRLEFLVAKEFLGMQRREGRSEATFSKNRWLLEPAFAAFGDRPIGELTALELLHALRKFELRGRYESARRLRTIAGMIFRYAIATGRASREIALDLRGALTKITRRAAITDPKEIGITVTVHLTNSDCANDASSR